MSGIVSRYGLPEVVITDKGKELTAQAWEEFLKECGIDHRTTTPYHPQTNGRVERFNGTLKRLLAKLVKNDLPAWESFLPDALWAYRTTTHASTGMTPYGALFGLAPRLPGQIVRGQPVSQHRARLREAREAARKAQVRAGTSRLLRRQRNQPAAEVLHPGDLVILKQHVGLTLQAKGDPGWVVEEVRGPVIRISRDQQVRTVNREHLVKAPPGAEFVHLESRRRKWKMEPEWLSEPKF